MNQVSLSSSQPLTNQSGIYIIIHSSGTKLYVGSALRFTQRHGEHQRMLRRSAHENDHLQKAWNAHGPEAFTFVPLFVCAPADLLYYEQRAMDFYKQKVGWRQMYNSNPHAASGLGRIKSPEERAKISARLIGNKYTLGYSPTPETRAKIAEATRRRNLGSKMSEETKKKIGDANRGRVPSAETRAKMSAANKGRKLTPNQIAGLARASRMRGKHHTEEAKAKISRALKGRIRSRNKDGKYQPEGGA